MKHESDKALLEELTSIAKDERLEFIASQPPESLLRFKRLLGQDDIRKLNAHIDRRVLESRKPTFEKWIDEARAGHATSPDAMIEVLRENESKLRPTDAQWVSRISESAAGRSFSQKQAGVIRAIYSRYFGSQADS